MEKFDPVFYGYLMLGVAGSLLVQWMVIILLTLKYVPRETVRFIVASACTVMTILAVLIATMVPAAQLLAPQLISH